MVIKKMVVSILAGIFITYFPSCYSKQVVPYPEINKDDLVKIEKVITKSGNYYKLENTEVVNDYIRSISTKSDDILVTKIETLTIMLTDGTLQKVKPDELNNNPNKISKVLVKLKNGQELEFDTVQLINPYFLKGEKTTEHSIRIDDIQAALMEKSDTNKTVLAIIALPGYAGFIFVLGVFGF